MSLYFQMSLPTSWLPQHPKLVGIRQCGVQPRPHHIIYISLPQERERERGMNLEPTSGGIPMVSPVTVAHHTMRQEKAAIHMMEPKNVIGKNLRAEKGKRFRNIFFIHNQKNIDIRTCEKEYEVDLYIAKHLISSLSEYIYQNEIVGSIFFR